MGVAQFFKLYRILESNHRLTIHRVQVETGLSKRTVYRYLKELQKVMPIKMKNGVVVLKQDAVS